jgi:hypothetical protein
MISRKDSDFCIKIKPYFKKSNLSSLNMPYILLTQIFQILSLQPDFQLEPLKIKDLQPLL